ncbi:hypothetical protein D6779_09880 [Candidatus Parcubacteria bacterium]|nr:MAG: hypothetical protein D6779_09880 [Candidatus Parcubacteria bacterium]
MNCADLHPGDIVSVNDKLAIVEKVFQKPTVEIVFIEESEQSLTIQGGSENMILIKDSSSAAKTLADKFVSSRNECKALKEEIAKRDNAILQLRAELAELKAVLLQLQLQQAN